MAVSPVPFRDVIANVKTMVVSAEWVRWLTSLVLAVNAVPQKIGGANLTAQAAAIVAVAIPAPTLTAGLYRVTYTARITQAASVSSSLTVTIAWTDGAAAQSVSGAAMTGNTTATMQQDSFLIHVDQATTVTYATAYASVGATAMQYALYVRLESVP